MESDDGVREALLSESEATLRQVKGVLSDFATQGDGARGTGDAPDGLAALVRVLVTSYTEVMEVIDNLRKSRGLLEDASMDRLQKTHHKLAEVNSATEVAATGIMDSIDRALELVDELDLAADEDERSTGRTQLRHELHQIMDLLQFQDITAQQLGYASAVLFDVEQRLVELSGAFDRGMGLAGVELRAARPDLLGETCDPEASTLDAEGRQALADEIFTPAPDG